MRMNRPVLPTNGAAAAHGRIIIIITVVDVVVVVLFCWCRWFCVSACPGRVRIDMVDRWIDGLVDRLTD